MRTKQKGEKDYSFYMVSLEYRFIHMCVPGNLWTIIFFDKNMTLISLLPFPYVRILHSNTKENSMKPTLASRTHSTEPHCCLFFYTYNKLCVSIFVVCCFLRGWELRKNRKRIDKTANKLISIYKYLYVRKKFENLPSNMILYDCHTACSPFLPLLSHSFLPLPNVCL